MRAVSGGSTRAFDRAYTRILDLASVLDRAFDLAIDRVLDLAIDFDLARVRIVANRRRREASRVAPAAGRLVVAAAARLLPTRERARYAEEFRSELWEIAHAGGRRRAQLAYAARQVMSAWRLRAELRVPRRRGAAR